MCFDHCEGDAFDPLQDLLDAKALVEANPIGYTPTLYPAWMFEEFDQA